MKPSPLFLSLCFIAGCAHPGVESVQMAEAPPSAACDSFGYERGTEAYEQCAIEVDKALWRAARAPRARLNCTPMGDRVVCQ